MHIAIKQLKAKMEKHFKSNIRKSTHCMLGNIDNNGSLLFRNNEHQKTMEFQVLKERKNDNSEFISGNNLYYK